MGPVVDSNEVMRCEYISTILHTAVSILEGLVILPQMEVSGDESSGRVDYAIKNHRQFVGRNNMHYGR